MLVTMLTAMYMVVRVVESVRKLEITIEIEKAVVLYLLYVSRKNEVYKS